jgi:hypothetical protein
VVKNLIVHFFVVKTEGLVIRINGLSQFGISLGPRRRQIGALLEDRANGFQCLDAKWVKFETLSQFFFGAIVVRSTVVDLPQLAAG